ncbi:oogenesis-related isoform X1 [Lepisosteus oculatus]|uniref:oogenesis-related isoform X1 n=1 Tax=Lepisosteus oculatus TaxID=7918 RepID=UPI0037244EA7
MTLNCNSHEADREPKVAAASAISSSKPTVGAGCPDKAAPKGIGLLASVLGHLLKLWPVCLVVRALRSLSWLSRPAGGGVAAETSSPSPGRFCRSGRKRLRRITRLLLAFTPLRLQSALGYPVCTSIGCSVSEEVRSSPTKPCGKGCKRKQEDVEEEEQQSWVEALTQELGEDDSQADPDYEPSSQGETDSEENRTHNDTESDIEVETCEGVTMIKELPQDGPAEGEQKPVQC